MRITKLFMSDLHNGRGKNLSIGENLTLFLYSNEEFKNIDYIYITGDVTDKQLALDSTGAISLIRWFLNLAKFCIKHDIKLRFLKGTPSHDRNQIEVLALLNDMIIEGLDFLYINDIDIVQESDHTCLYVPDEISVTTQETYLRIIQLMQEKDIYKIDSAVMHGSFNFAMGFGEEEDLHRETDYLNIIEHYILCGHIHKFQIFDRIIIPGSTDRLSYNEEEPKGAVITIEDMENPSLDTFRFIQNEYAKLFTDINIKSVELDDFLKEIAKATIDMPNDSHVRLVIDNENPMRYYNGLENTFPNLNFDYKILDREEDVLEDSCPIEDEDVAFTSLDNPTIIGYIEDKLSKLTNLSPERMREITSLLRKD